MLINTINSAPTDCSTPADCYIRATALLQRDREEMRQQLDKYQSMYEGLVKENQSLKDSILNLQSSFNSKMEEINNTKLIEIGKSVVEKERDAVSHLLEVIDETFVEVVHTLSSLEGKLIITGMGKSGNIARKIASTLSSIGLPSLYLNPAEAKHGDLGVIKVGDVVMLLSNSGETDELNSIINY
jgi:DNA-binding MurR/RpiR family transcriptional regulator